MLGSIEVYNCYGQGIVERTMNTKSFGRKILNRNNYCCQKWENLFGFSWGFNNFERTIGWASLRVTQSIWFGCCYKPGRMWQCKTQMVSHSNCQPIPQSAHKAVSPYDSFGQRQVVLIWLQHQQANLYLQGNLYCIGFGLSQRARKDCGRSDRRIS